MDNGLVYPAMRSAEHPVWKLTFAQKEELATRYIAGERTADLAAEFSILGCSVLAIARRRGALKRGYKQLPLNHAAFSEITPNSAYWIGFLMADGCVTKNVVKLALGERDRVHLEMFHKFLGAQYKITTTTNKGVTTCSFAASSKRIQADIAAYGVVPRKSLTAKCIGLETSRDFWRGVMDGDGWLGIKTTRSRWGYPAMTLCGSFNLMTQFAQFVGLHCPDRVPVARRRGTIFAVQITGPRAIKMAQILYEGAETALDRKHTLAIGMFSPQSPV